MLCKFSHASGSAYQCVYCVWMTEFAICCLPLSFQLTYLKKDLTLNPYRGNLPRLSGRQSPWVLLSPSVLWQNCLKTTDILVLGTKKWVFMLLQQGFQVVHQLNYHSSPRNYFSYQAQSLEESLFSTNVIHNLPSVYVKSI